MAKKKFRNGDIVAYKHGDKWFVYIYRDIQVGVNRGHVGPTIGDGNHEGFSKYVRYLGPLPVLTDFAGIVRRRKFTEDKLILTTELIAKLRHEVQTFRAKQ